VITRFGFESVKSVLSKEITLWIGSDVLSDSELAELRESGIQVTNFSFKINLFDKELLDSAIETIKEHHPKQPIFMEM
jgi:hypothetical protein